MINTKVFGILKQLYEQNEKPHMMYLVLDMHLDGDFHRGKELVDKGHDTTEVYDAIQRLTIKGDLTRFGKKTKITPKGKKTLKFIDEITEVAEKIVIK